MTEDPTMLPEEFAKHQAAINPEPPEEVNDLLGAVLFEDLNKLKFMEGVSNVQHQAYPLVTSFTYTRGGKSWNVLITCGG